MVDFFSWVYQPKDIQFGGLHFWIAILFADALQPDVAYNHWVNIQYYSNNHQMYLVVL